MGSATDDSPNKKTKKISIARKFLYGIVIIISLFLFLISIAAFYIGLTISGFAALQAPSFLLIGGMSTIAGGFLVYLVKRDHDKKSNK